MMRPVTNCWVHWGWTLTGTKSEARMTDRAAWERRIFITLLSTAILTSGLLDWTSWKVEFHGAHAAGGCAPDPQPTISPQTPSDVCIANFNILPIQFFDDY